MRKALSILTVMLAGTSFVRAQSVAFQLSADRDSAGLGEVLTLTLSSDEPLANSTRWSWPELATGDTLAQGWEILSASTVDSTSSPALEVGIRRTQSIEVLAWDTGFKVIEPLILFNEAGDTVRSPALLVQVGLTPLETNPAPKPLQGFAEFRWSWWERLSRHWPWAAVLAALAALGYVIRKGLLRPDQAAEEVPIAPAEPGHLIAWRLLRELNDERPWLDGRDKETQSRLSDAIRLHLDSAFGVKSLERATTELVAQLQHSAIRGLDAADAAWLTDVLQRSDLVKFAKQSMPTDAHARAVQDALRWVERTQPDTNEAGSASNTPEDHG